MNYDFRCYKDYVKSGLFNLQQLGEIKKGLLENSHNVKKYANPELNWQQMREIRLALKRKIDISEFVSPDVDWRELEAIRVSLVLNKRNKIKELWKNMGV